jgi:hypothetical protein
MRSFLKTLGVVLTACALIAPYNRVACAGEAGANVKVSGAVLPALRLSARSLTDGVTIQTAESESIDLMLKSDGGFKALPAILTFEIRTNVAYRLRLNMVAREDCAPEITAVVGSVQTTGVKVMAGAAENSRLSEATSFRETSASETLLSGPRVSAFGTLTSPGNALLVELRLEPDPHHTAMCAWRVNLRLSLEERDK